MSTDFLPADPPASIAGRRLPPRFAMMEGVLVLATILRHFRLEMAGPDPVPFPSITLRPEGGPIMRVSRRVEA